MHKNAAIAKITNTVVTLLGGVLVVGVGLSGCSSVPTTKQSNKGGVQSGISKNDEQVIVVNHLRGKAIAGAQVRQQSAGNAHQLAYEKKRQWYHQKWEAEQSAKREAKRQEYRQKHLQQQRQQQQQQQALPHYANRPIYDGAASPAYNRAPRQVDRVRSRPAARSRQPQNRRYVAARRPQQYVENGNLANNLSSAAIARTFQRVKYDGRYIPIAYPMGDVPSNIGVCTDTVVRSYRRLGIDLQRLVHEDISRAFYAYPNLPKWGLAGPDTNIDHRRVHNLKVFFARHGRRLPVTNNPRDYQPGDLVTWHLGGDQEHIGIVVNKRSPEDPNRYMIVHNIAHGDKLEDVLFRMPITGHYRYLPSHRQPWLAAR